MTRFMISFVVLALFASFVHAGELRTGRGTRKFVVDPAAKESLTAELRKASPSSSTDTRHRGESSRDGNVFRQASWRADDVRPLTADAVQPAVDLGLESTEWIGDGCGECGLCSQCANYWFQGEFLLWWRRGRSLPPLASTNVLRTGDVLYGNQVVGDSARPGARFELGGFLDYDHCDSVAGRFWALGDSRSRFDSRNLPAGTTVVRPFVDVEPTSPTFNTEIALPIDGIGGSSGHMQVSTDATVWGGEVLLRHAFYRTHNTRGDLIYGYQATRVDEDVAINHNFTNAGINVIGRDVFDTKNAFHGAVLGLQVVSEQGPWTIDLMAKLGLGDMHQRVNISGFAIQNDGVTEQTFDGSLLALPSNIGFRERNKFAVVPELGIQTRWRTRPNMELSLGYSFVYWSDVVQASDIIDRVVNGSQTSDRPLNGAARPEFRFGDGSYWVHGLSLGLTWTH